MDKQSILGNNDIEDVRWLCSLSESEIDLLMALKNLVHIRAEKIGHEDLRKEFNLGMLRKLAAQCTGIWKGRLKDMGITSSFDSILLDQNLCGDFGSMTANDLYPFIRPDDDRKRKRISDIFVDSKPKSSTKIYHLELKNRGMEAILPSSFTDFPEDVLICILSFLRPSELAAFSATSRRYETMCRNDQRLWFAMCERRWGSKTLIKKWGSGKISYRQLYSFLDEYGNLIGFWRRCGDVNLPSSRLVFFEWGPFYITGSMISPSKNGGYGVVKKPFMWISIDSSGEPLSYLDFDGRVPLTTGEDLMNMKVLGGLESELLQVNVCFMGKSHLVVEEKSELWRLDRVICSENVKGDECENGYGSPPGRLISEIYQYFANRTSPGSSSRLSRELRKREKEKRGRTRKWESEHYVKIVDHSPNPARPFQGLWKGINEDMNLDFYLVSYDDMGGIACRQIGDSFRSVAFQAPIFWTSSTTFIESPLSPEEAHIFNSRIHLQPSLEMDPYLDHISTRDNKTVSRMLCINSSYDLVIPDLAVSSLNSQQVEGRIWQYRNGTCGFGFLRDNFIIDLRFISENDQILEEIESSD